MFSKKYVVLSLFLKGGIQDFTYALQMNKSGKILKVDLYRCMVTLFRILTWGYTKAHFMIIDIFISSANKLIVVLMGLS